MKELYFETISIGRVFSTNYKENCMPSLLESRLNTYHLSANEYLHSLTIL